MRCDSTYKRDQPITSEFFNLAESSGHIDGGKEYDPLRTGDLENNFDRYDGSDSQIRDESIHQIEVTKFDENPILDGKMT
jgi:hypothetical protein